MTRPPDGRIGGLSMPAAWMILFSVIPLLGGGARLLQMVTGDAPSPADLRFAASPTPVTPHIVAATIYSLVGALQFDRGLRGRWPGLHRILGRMVVACGLIVAVSGLWMTTTFEIPPSLQGDLLRFARLAVGASMAAFLLLGVVAIRAGRVRDHLAWMARAYALAIGAGTQALLLLPPTLAFGEVTGLVRDLAMTVAWILNLLTVEWMLRRPLQLPAAKAAVRTFGQARRW